jgi:hypothetical protein
MWLYQNSDDNKARYILGEEGKNKLIVIGVNPSTAEPDNLDPTLKNVKTKSSLSGYDGWLMINLYPQRATDPKDLHKIINPQYHKDNLQKISAFITCESTIWAAWGTLIKTRPYLHSCLEDIYKITLNTNCNWISFGKKSKDGHPHHPLYLRHDSQPEYFDIKKYLNL